MEGSNRADRDLVMSDLEVNVQISVIVSRLN